VVLQPVVQWLGQLGTATHGKSMSGGALNGVQEPLRVQKSPLRSAKSALKRNCDPYGF
jgi:hypothetical protein